MFLELEFEELENAFDLELEQVTEISDGGYDRGYGDAMEETEAEATIQEDLLSQVSEALANKVSGYERGKKEGFAEALDKRTDLVVTANGEYTPSEDSTGFKSVSVAVKGKLPQVLERAVTRLDEEDFGNSTTIPNYFFEGCKLLESVVFSKNVTNVGNYSFQNCTKLNTLVLQEGLKDTGHYSFENCSSLVSVTIPSSVGTLSSGSFRGCSKLSEVIFADGIKITTIPSQYFYFCSSLSEIEIPETVKTIKQYSFRSCNLKQLKIPSSVIQIENYAFLDNPYLSKIVVKPSAPPSLGSSVFDTKGLNEIVVPIGCGDAYKSATNWSAYADYIVEGDV